MSEENPGCGRAGAVMLFVCSLPLLAIGITLMIVFVNFRPAYIAGIVLLSIAAFMFVCGIATGIASCVIKQQKISDIYQANHKQARCSQATIRTTATMETVATRVTLAPSLSAFVFEEETPPPSYENFIHVAPHSVVDRKNFMPMSESGQEYGHQRF